MLPTLYWLMIYVYIILLKKKEFISDSYVVLFIASSWHNKNYFIPYLKLAFNVSLSEILYNSLINSVNNKISWMIISDIQY